MTDCPLPWAFIFSLSPFFVNLALRRASYLEAPAPNFVNTLDSAKPEQRASVGMKPLRAPFCNAIAEARPGLLQYLLHLLFPSWAGSSSMDQLPLPLSCSRSRSRLNPRFSLADRSTTPGVSLRPQGSESYWLLGSLLNFLRETVSLHQAVRGKLNFLAFLIKPYGRLKF